MQTVTQEFLAELKKPVLGTAAVRARLAMADYPAQSTAAPTAESTLPGCFAAEPLARHGAHGRGLTATLEKNRTRLGENFVLPGSAYNTDGWISRQISDERGCFAHPPAYTVRFAAPACCPGLTLRFDKGGDDCPAFTLVLFDQAGECYRQRHTAPGGVFTLKKELSGLCAVTITVEKTQKPFQHARLAQVLAGLYLELGEGAVQRAAVTYRADAVCRRLPAQTLSLEIVNLPALTGQPPYDPHRPAGIWKYADSRCPLTLTLGQQLTGPRGGWQWVKGGELFLTGRPKANGMSLTFEAADILTLLQEDYTPTGWFLTRYDLSTLFQQMLAKTQAQGLFPQDEICRVGMPLQRATTNAPLKKRPVKEYAQLFSHGAACPLTLDRAGRLVADKTSEQPVGSIPLACQLGEGPVCHKNPPAAATSCPAFSYRAGEKERLFSLEDTVANTRSLRAEYPFAGNLSARYDESRGVRYQLELQPTGADITLTGPGTASLEIFGTRPVESRQLVTVQSALGPQGETEKLENPLIISPENARAVAAWVQAELDRRNVFTVKTRGEIHLDPLDVVELELPGGESVPARIAENRLEFAGGSLQGTLIVKQLERRAESHVASPANELAHR